MKRFIFVLVIVSILMPFGLRVASADAGISCCGGPGEPTCVPQPTKTPRPTKEPTKVPTTIPPTDVPPTSVPPTQVPPTDVPPTQVPPTIAPPTNVPPTHVPTKTPDDPRKPKKTKVPTLYYPSITPTYSATQVTCITDCEFKNLVLELLRRILVEVQLMNMKGV